VFGLVAVTPRWRYEEAGQAMAAADGDVLAGVCRRPVAQGRMPDNAQEDSWTEPPWKSAAKARTNRVNNSVLGRRMQDDVT
jgi:hypothetical protein